MNISLFMELNTYLKFWTRQSTYRIESISLFDDSPITYWKSLIQNRLLNKFSRQVELGTPALKMVYITKQVTVKF